MISSLSFSQKPVPTFDIDPQDGGGGGVAYADLVLHAVMPFVEKNYRVLPGAASTFIGGSSLGALVSLEIARRHPGIFSGVLALSPSLWWDNQTTIDDLAKDPAGLVGTRVWIDIGTREVVPLAARPGRWTRRTSGRWKKLAGSTRFSETPGSRKS